MKSNFDTQVTEGLNNILEGEEQQIGSEKIDQSKNKALEGSRQSTNPSSRSSPSHSHQIAFSSELPFSKRREVW